MENLGTFVIFGVNLRLFSVKKQPLSLRKRPTGQQILYHVNRFQHSSPRILSKI